jgi:hypothetical protein
VQQAIQAANPKQLEEAGQKPQHLAEAGHSLRTAVAACSQGLGCPSILVGLKSEYFAI